MVAAEVFFDVFGSSSAEGRQGSGAQPGTAGALLEGQRNAEWCEELWFSYSLNFLLKIQLLPQSNSLQIIQRLFSMCSILWCTLTLSASFESAAWWCQYFPRITGGADEWGEDKSVAHWCKDKWHANGGGPLWPSHKSIKRYFSMFSSMVGILALS